MKYFVDLQSTMHTIEVPDDAKVEHGIAHLFSEGKENNIPELKFLDSEGRLLGAFTGVMNFYREDLKPKKTDWVEDN